MEGSDAWCSYPRLDWRTSACFKPVAYSRYVHICRHLAWEPLVHGYIGHSRNGRQGNGVSTPRAHLMPWGCHDCPISMASA